MFLQESAKLYVLMEKKMYTWQWHPANVLCNLLFWQHGFLRLILREIQLKYCLGNNA